MRDIGKNIRDLRQSKGMTQEELAEKLFVTRQTISNYEKGKTRPDIDMLIKMSTLLAVDVNYILYGIPSVHDKNNKIKQICIFALFFLGVSIIYSILFDWALHIKRNEYNSFPIYWTLILFRPLVAFLLGRTMILVLGSFIKLPPSTQQKCNRIKQAVIFLILLYIIIMLPFLCLDLWPWTLPPAWNQIAYYLLGLLPSHTCFFNNSFWGIMLGFFSIIFDSCPKNTPKQDTP